jgi:hypothetical protein
MDMFTLLGCAFGAEVDENDKDEEEALERGIENDFKWLTRAKLASPPAFANDLVANEINDLGNMYENEIVLKMTFTKRGISSAQLIRSTK